MTLARTLDGLLAQAYPPDLLSLVVVDDGSTDETPAVIQAAAARSPFSLRAIRQERQGPAAARNRGVAGCDSEFVGFTDSDCRLPATWVRHAVGRFAPGVGLVSGPIVPINDRRPPAGFFQHQLPETNREYAFYPTANVFYRREAFERVTGFDERFGAYPWGTPVGGEDADLAWRVKRAGYRSAFAADAPVEHEASALSPARWLLEPLHVQTVPMLVARFPELRQQALAWGYVADRADLLFYLAVLGLLLGVKRSPFLFLLVAPWAWQLRGLVSDDLRAPSRWGRAVAKYGLLFARFSLFTGTLVFSSVRYRALVI